IPTTLKRDRDTLLATPESFEPFLILLIISTALIDPARTTDAQNITVYPNTPNNPPPHKRKKIVQDATRFNSTTTPPPLDSQNSNK
ncbi:3030_t:CDS:1, partial [Dentiscutata heterogama]